MAAEESSWRFQEGPKVSKSGLLSLPEAWSVIKQQAEEQEGRIEALGTTLFGEPGRRGGFLLAVDSTACQREPS